MLAGRRRVSYMVLCVIFAIGCLEQVHVLLLFCSAPSPSHGLGLRVGWRLSVQRRSGRHGAADPTNYGPVSFGNPTNCLREEILEYAQRVAKDKGKTEDLGMRSLKSTKDYENYLRKRHKEGIFGSVEIDKDRYNNVYSKTILLDGITECIVKVKFDTTVQGGARSKVQTTGNMPKWFRHAFMAMGVGFK